MIFSQPDRFPELKNYLSKKPVELTGKEKVLVYAVMGAVATIAGVLMGIAPIIRPVPVWPAELGFVAAVSAGVWLILRGARLARRHEPAVRQESVAVRRHLKESVDSGVRIDHALPFSVGMVLEECAIAWRRINDCLNGPVWKDAGLGSHWASVRENAQKAADAAMDEVMAMASPHVTDPHEAGKIRSLQQLIQRVAGTEEVEMAPLPPSFTPALATADQLRTLALEVESATISVTQDGGLRENLQATTQISGVLGELRNLQQAEDELHQSN